MADLNKERTSEEQYNERKNEAANPAYAGIGEIVDALQEIFTGHNPEDEGLGDPR